MLWSKVGNLIQFLIATHQVYESCFFFRLQCRCRDMRHKVLKSGHIKLHSFNQKIFQDVLLLQYCKLQKKFRAA